MRVVDRDLIRGGHYGQRSCEPHLKAEHMAAPTKPATREDSSCQSGAVHTWHDAAERGRPLHGRYRGQTGHEADSSIRFRLTLSGPLGISSYSGPAGSPRWVLLVFQIGMRLSLGLSDMGDDQGGNWNGEVVQRD